MKHSLKKTEILRSKKMIERLFLGGASSFSMYPLRVVYLPCERRDSKVEILISVSKRKFKHAVDRNRMKRLIREAYRLNKYSLLDSIEDDKSYVLAFIYLSDKLMPYRKIEEKMKLALSRIADNVIKEKTDVEDNM